MIEPTFRTAVNLDRDTHMNLLALCKRVGETKKDIISLAINELAEKLISSQSPFSSDK